MPDIVYVNGKYLPREKALVSVEDRGFQFADGIYEVTKFYGRRPFRLDAHLQRLSRSADHMRFGGTLRLEQWQDVIDELVRACDIPDDPGVTHVLYQQVTRGACPRAHLFPREPLEPTSVAYFRKAPAYDAALRYRSVGAER
jgi:D-alanine transaminase